MKVLIKIGGTLLDQAGARASLAGQIAAVGRRHELVVVHGGGKQLSGYLAERGVESRFVNGLRVSDEAVIEGAARVIAGGVNKQLVAALSGAGARAVGLSGVDGGLTMARPLDPALGFVGEPVKANGTLLELLAGAGYLPVIACLAADESGQIYNVNADRMAVAVAAAFQAHTLVFLTDVPGVKTRSGRVAERLDTDHIAELIASGVAHGGMQAKLEAAALALGAGVAEVVIAPGAEPDVCERILEKAEALGSRIESASLGAAR